jgi:hypothetical protein
MINQVRPLRVAGESPCHPQAQNQARSDEQPIPTTLTDEQQEALKSIGGEPLAGSGLEEEEPEENFL